MNDTSAHIELQPSPDVSAPPGASATPLFELNSASFSVEKRVLLKPLTLTLPTRKVIGLIGHNGSGKSTLIKLLARQQTPTDGSISFEGKNWRDGAIAHSPARLPISRNRHRARLACLSANWWHSVAIPGMDLSVALAPRTKEWWRKRWS